MSVDFLVVCFFCFSLLVSSTLHLCTFNRVTFKAQIIPMFFKTLKWYDKMLIDSVRSSRMETYLAFVHGLRTAARHFPV